MDPRPRRLVLLRPRVLPARAGIGRLVPAARVAYHVRPHGHAAHPPLVRPAQRLHRAHVLLRAALRHAGCGRAALRALLARLRRAASGPRRGARRAGERRQARRAQPHPRSVGQARRLLQADDAPPRGRRPRLPAARRERAAHPRSAGDAALAGRADPAAGAARHRLRRAGRAAGRAAQGRPEPARAGRARAAARSRGRAHAALRPAQAALRARHAALARGPAARGRRVGEALVPGRAPEQRLRALPSQDGRLPAAAAAAARPVPQALRPRRGPRAASAAGGGADGMSLDPSTLPDPRNAQILVHVGGRLLSRAEAKVSVFDSVVQGGDACWEGLRVYDGRVFKLGAHLDRLFASAHALAFERVPSRDDVRQALFECLRANGMRDGAHVRLPLTRGEKVTSGMSPRWNRGPCTLIIVPEWKPPVFGGRGLVLVTSSWRRNPPQCLDSRIHHNNLLNNILAKIEADAAGADDAIMLDLAGFVAETNATNLFHVARGELHTPATGACLPGITRATVLELARRAGLATHERG